MSLTNVSFLLQKLKQSWLIENFPYKLQIPRAWAWKPIEGTQVSFARTNQMDAASLADVNTGACDTESPDRTNQPDSEAIFELVSLMTRYQICMADLDRVRYPELLKEIEFELAKTRLLYRYFQRVGENTGATNLFPGLRNMVGTGQTIAMGGAALTFAAMDQAYNLIKSNQGRPNAIMSNSRAQRTFANLYFGAGAGEPPMIADTWFDPIRGQVTAGITSFKGTPWYINDLIDDLPSSQGIIYFMVLGDDEGPGHERGIVGLVPTDLASTWFVKREANGVIGTQTITVPDPGNPITVQLPTLPTQDTWVSWPTGIAMGSQGSLSILSGFALVANLPVT
ncbi:MAG TPA: hypothetical protein PLF37_00975 [Planctomycetota bacterium]|nr:hypothetical protein [Planctomycetota bacterium]